MISDWRGERRIGSPPLSERAGGPLRLALIFVALIATESAFVVFIKTLGDPLNWFSNLRLWALIFGGQTAVIAIAACFGPRKTLAIAVGLIGGVLALLVWFLAPSILDLFGVVMIVPNP